jgi:hypothetical protein
VIAVGGNIRSFLTRAERDGHVRTRSPWGNQFWSEIPVSLIAEVLSLFKIHPLNMTFQGKAIADFIESADIESLKTWDVVLPNGSELGTELIPGLSYEPQKRSVTEPGPDEILVSGSSARVGSRGVEREGLPRDLAEKLATKYLAANPGKKSVPDHVYREARKRPLLLIHSINAYVREGGKRDGSMIESRIDVGSDPLVALGLSFPRFDD